ncbi:Smr/MutS family protein [Oricola sp.]|uniref:Smr/MutS family protein n=1 Tax=Oricola sp. TaxID=1979950 RepID=UPI0025DFCCE3|nr:Smr/MutS family protein [Oricola sp.]MCI5077532.1 Smr/MutS family protein [Oricola sp.]
MTGKRNRRALSEEETLLWHQVKRTVTPLHDRPVVSSALTQQEAARAFHEAMHEGEKRKSDKPASKDDIRSPAFQARRPPPPKQTPRPDPVIDKPTTRKLAKGRISIDARIDLHAMTQNQAHDRLYGFLADARSNGCRHVLVVTGKGRSLGSEGVLKRMVPVWLNSPRFADIVSGYSSAHRAHGGEGAIYIRLRRLTRGDGSFR